jgi:SNF2 family DNA or RNA helicase
VLGEVEKNGIGKSQIQILAGLTRLRQAACDPRLLGLPRDYSDDDSGKLVALRELLANAVEGGHKVLVFSQFVQMLKLVEKAIKEDGIKYEYLDGSTKDRAERVDRFQGDPTVGAFLISLKAGGTGLNLTAADTVIHFDPWWNPAVEQQATDRAHRIGQNKVVSVYRLVAAGTIEEKILQLKAKKRELVASVLSEDAGGVKKLTKQDLEELFSVE